MSRGFSQVQDVHYFQTLAPTLSSGSVEILAAVGNVHGFKQFRPDVAQAFVRAKLDAGMYRKLRGGCVDIT